MTMQLIVEIDNRLKNELKAAAYREGKTMAKVIRTLIGDYVNARSITKTGVGGGNKKIGGRDKLKAMGASKAKRGSKADGSTSKSRTKNGTGIVR